LLVEYLFVGPLAFAYVLLFIGGFVLWWFTTRRVPIDPHNVVVPYLLTVIMFIAHVYEEFDLGPVEVLVTSAGGSFTPPGPIEEISEEAWRASIDGNLAATFLTIKSVLPGMKERRAGNIITISSSAGRVPHMRAPIPYSVAKAGIELMTQDVAAQAGPYNIRANCIAPETILTERNQQRIPDERKASMAESRPLKRLGTPNDIAQAALFLASDDASWITGVVLDVSGGAVMLR
jgi:3-oxoacyl-[acyl-carrier protein] reductase